MLDTKLQERVEDLLKNLGYAFNILFSKIEELEQENTDLKQKTNK